MTLLASSKWYLAPQIDPRTLIKPLDQVEKATIESAMILCEGNMKEASRRLQISYTSLRMKLALYRRGDDHAS